MMARHIDTSRYCWRMWACGLIRGCRRAWRLRPYARDYVVYRTVDPWRAP